MQDEHAIEVPERLRPWFSGMTVARAETETIVREVPDNATTLALRSAPGERTRLMAMGPRTRPLYYEGGPGPSCVQLRIRPGRAAALLGVPPRDLVNEAVLLEIGEEDLVAAAERLIARADGHSRHADLVADAADLLPEIGVRAGAKRLHLSERHLRNLFADHIGLAPKQFARLGRVRAVLESGRKERWSALALALGYTDHSHLTADFRAIMGVPPSRYFNDEIAPNTDCQKQSPI